MALLTVELPTYNEAENLPVIVHELEELAIDIEIVIIDDGSPDGTGKIAQELASRYGNIKVVEREKKEGIASAIAEGLKVASGKYVVVMDADGQHPVNMIPLMLERAASADIVIASRYVRGGACELGFTRKLVSRVSTALAHLLIPETKKIMDPLSGFFLFRRELFSDDFVISDGYKILLIMLAGCRNCSVVEIPYSFGNRMAGKSKFGLREMFRYVKLLFKLSDYRVLKFVLVGAIGAVINELLLFLLVHHIPLLFASAAAVEASIISNFVMNNTWTFAIRKRVNFLKRFVGYHGVAILGAAINIGLLALLVFMHFEYLGANLIGIMFGFTANYLGSEHLVWR